MEEWLEISKTYLEIGILGLCAILVVAMTWLNFKRNNKNSDEDKENRDDRLDKMLDNMQKQNETFQQMLINNVVQGVANHVPSKEENEKVTRITEEINNALSEMLIKTKADRAYLIQYHNGGKGINKQPFLKMSITNEQVQVGIKPFISSFKDQFRTIISYVIKQLAEVGYCYIKDPEEIKELDPSTYELLISRKIQGQYSLALHDPDSDVIAFVCLEYEDDTKTNFEAIKEIFEEKQKILETLLNL